MQEALAQSEAGVGGAGSDGPKFGGRRRLIPPVVFASSRTVDLRSRNIKNLYFPGRRYLQEHENAARPSEARRFPGCSASAAAGR